MHHVNIKSQAICSSVTALGLLKMMNGNEWTAISRTLTLHMILVKLKVVINIDAPVQHV